MNKIDPTPKEQALIYAGMGLKVFPCRNSGDSIKAPLTPNGFHDASDDPEQIKTWWSKFPKAFIGIATGKVSGFFVIDVDIKNGKDGRASLKNHFGDSLIMDDDTIIQKTMSGGYHICFKYDESHPVSNSQDLLEGIDIRGDGGYIIAAPSKGYLKDVWGEYRWNNESLKFTDVPEWVYRLIDLPSRSGNKSNKKDVDLEQAFLNGLSEGQRDQDIFNLAMLCKRQKISKETSMLIVSMVAEKCKPAFDLAEAMDKVERVFSYQSPKTKRKQEINDLESQIKLLEEEMKGLSK